MSTPEWCILYHKQSHYPRLYIIRETVSIYIDEKVVKKKIALSLPLTLVM